MTDFLIFIKIFDIASAFHAFNITFDLLGLQSIITFETPENVPIIGQ